MDAKNNFRESSVNERTGNSIQQWCETSSHGADQFAGSAAAYQSANWLPV